MKAKNIEWDVGAEDILTEVDNMSIDKISNLMGISTDYFNAMTEKEQHDYVLDYVYHTPTFYAKFLKDFFNLPQEVEIPESLAKQYSEDNYAEEISDWLSDTYEVCHGGFEIDEELEKDDSEIEKQ